MYKPAAAILFLLSLLMTTSLFAKQTSTTDSRFMPLFKHWTEAFNHRDAAAACSLFSPRVVADYYGVTRKNYTSICEGFKKIFRDKNNRYHYDFILHESYQDGNLAAVRITWYLKVYEQGKLLSLTQDEGMDILEKNQRGQWKIVNYLAYGVTKKI